MPCDYRSRPRRSHILKIWPEHYWSVHSGEKLAELRKDDRDAQVGDVLFPQPWSPKEFQPGVPQGHLNWPAIRAVVGHAARGSHIPAGLVMLSLHDVREATIEEENAAMNEPGAYGQAVKLGAKE